MSDMSLEQAAAFVDAMDAPVAAAPVAKEPETEQVAEAVEPVEPVEEQVQTEPVEAEAEAEPVEEGEEQAEAIAPVEVPQWWDKEAQEAFKALPPAAQAIVKAQEDKREAVVSKAKAAHIEGLNLAKTQAEAAKQAAEKIAAVLPDQRKQFEDYYESIDWDAYLLQDRDAALADHLKYQQGLKHFDQLERAKAEAEQAWRSNFMTTEAARLKELAPDLAGSESDLRATADYIIKQGFSAEELQTAEAPALVIANKARLYDEMMAKAAAKPATPPIKQPTPAKVPPQGQARPTSTSRERDISETRNRLNQTRSIDDAAAYIAKLGF